MYTLDSEVGQALLESFVQGGADPKKIEEFKRTLSKLSPEEQDILFKGQISKMTGRYKDAPKTPKPPKTTFKDDKMITKSQPYGEKLGGHMTGNMEREKIDTRMEGRTGDFARTQAKAAERANLKAKTNALKSLRDQNAEKMFGKMGSKLKKLSKFAKKVPGVGMVAGPALAASGSLLAGESAPEAAFAAAEGFSPVSADEAEMALFGQLGGDEDTPQARLERGEATPEDYKALTREAQDTESRHMRDERDAEEMAQSQKAMKSALESMSNQQIEEAEEDEKPKRKFGALE